MDDVYSVTGHFVPPSSGLPSPLNLCVEKRLFFNLSVLEQAEQVTMGQLELRFSRNTYYGRTFNLRLYRILQMSLKGMGSHKTSRELLLGQTFRLLHKSLHFNLTDVCQIWRDPKQNLGLTLEILHRGDGTFEECRGVQTSLYTSLLMVSLNPLQCRKPRKKRSYSRLPFLASNICMKRRLYVDFREVGWHRWVIAPRGFLANYCDGECPYPLTDVLNGTNHAILQTLANSYDPGNISPPCCVPTKMAPVSMLLYENDDNVVLRHYEDMSVAECGCR